MRPFVFGYTWKSILTPLKRATTQKTDRGRQLHYPPPISNL